MARPGPLTVTFAEIDLRPGGKYRIHMTEPDGTEHKVSGVYREIDPPKKLVYSWGWDGDHPVKDSTVTLEFFERGEATKSCSRTRASRTTRSVRSTLKGGRRDPRQARRALRREH